jgi:hypothetical protein
LGIINKESRNAGMPVRQKSSCVPSFLGSLELVGDNEVDNQTFANGEGLIIRYLGRHEVLYATAS